jgi:HEAT repeat protein
MLHAGGDGTVARARELLLPPAGVRERYARLLDQLADEDAKVHDRAKEALVGMGESVVVPLIDRSLQDALEPYQRQRLRAVRARLTTDDEAAEARRAAVVVAALRQIGTAKADALLAELARDKAGRVWADAAKAAR